MVQNGTILLFKNHKLDSRPLDEDPRSVEINLRWHVYDTILEGNPIR